MEGNNTRIELRRRVEKGGWFAVNHPCGAGVQQFRMGSDGLLESIAEERDERSRQDWRTLWTPASLEA
ncbi:hypothetical protein JS530_02135 [Bifidobacterium sp. LC6]|uniref:Uncharacterized protein n=1 Tax=Bifidobacterium colobi TaxID=2809026 RepID=A0ABS5UU37_9BIFI|nr:hypothetical protein [Bifidobacterium colobi]MBT1174320.1 hypothetical protein [Bifidobacterium colobi]